MLSATSVDIRPNTYVVAAPGLLSLYFGIGSSMGVGLLVIAGLGVPRQPIPGREDVSEETRFTLNPNP